MKNHSWWILVGVLSLSVGQQVLDPLLLISSVCSLLWEQISLNVKGWQEAVQHAIASINMSVSTTIRGLDVTEP